MAKAKSLYITLRDDPDLDIPEGESRESAAWNEMSQRVRQHKSNAKALAMASQVTEPTAVEKLADFGEKHFLQKIDYSYTRKKDGTEEFTWKGKPANEKQKQKIRRHQEKMGQKVTHMSDHQREQLQENIKRAVELGRPWSEDDIKDVTDQLEPNAPRNIPHDLIQEDSPRKQVSKITDKDGNIIQEIEKKKPLFGGEPKTKYKYHLDSKTSVSFSGEGDYENGVRGEVDQLLDRFRAIPEEARGKDASKNLKNLIEKHTKNKNPSQEDFESFMAEANDFEDNNINLSREEISEAVNKEGQTHLNPSGIPDAQNEASVGFRPKTLGQAIGDAEKQMPDNQGSVVLERRGNELVPKEDTARFEVSSASPFSSGGGRVEAIPVGPFKSKSEFLGYLRDFTGGTDVPGFGAIEKWFNNLPKSKKTQLAVNMEEYQDHIGEYSGSLRGEERDNFLNHLADNKNPFTVDAGVGAAELRSKGYIGKGQKPAGGKYRLSPDGASHLIGDSRLKQSSKNPFNISANRFNQHSADLTDEDAEWQAAERVARPDTLREKQDRLAREMLGDGIFEDRKAADRAIRETTDDDTDFDEHYEKIEQYHEDMGGHPIKSSGAGGHIKNINAGTTDTVRQHAPKTEEDTTPEATPEPKEKFEANIHGVNLTEDDVEKQPNGKYKLTADAQDSLFGYKQTIGESSFDRDPADNPRQAKYLEDLEFGAGETISGNVGKKVSWADPKDTPKTETTTRKPRTKTADDPGSQTIDTTREQLEQEEKDAAAAKKEQDDADKAAADKAAAEDVKPKGIKPDEVSAEQNESLGKMLGELGKKHTGKKSPEGDSFAKIQHLGITAARGELTSGEVSEIGKHLQEHGEDLDHLRERGFSTKETNFPLLTVGKRREQLAGERDAARKPTAPPTTEEEVEEEGEEEGDVIESVGTGDKEIDTKDKKADAKADKKAKADAADAEFEELFEDPKRNKKFREMYDAAGHDEDDFTFEDFKETQAIQYKKKGKAQYKLDFSNAHQKHKTSVASKEATQERDEIKDRNKEAKEESGELQQRLADQGHKVSQAKAAQLHQDHDGDVDAAVQSHSDDQEAAKSRKAKAEGEYPEDLTPDAIKQTLFGDKNPTGLLANHLPERNANKHGVKATALYRDLLVHHAEHGWPTSAKGKKQLTDTIALLRRPQTQIDGFSPKNGEQFADLEHAEQQLKDMHEQGIDPRTPEGKQHLAEQDRRLHETRQNYSDKHLNPSSREHHEENQRIWNHGNPNHVTKFDEDGNAVGRQKYNHQQGIHEDDEGNDVHHSPIKEMHHTLTEGQQESLDNLRRAHKVKEQVSKAPLNDDQRKLVEQYNDAHKAHEGLKDNALKPSPGEHHEDHANLDSAYQQHEGKIQESAQKLSGLHDKLLDSGVHGGGDFARGVAAVGEGGDVDKHIAEHTQNLENSGLKQSDFLHDEKDMPKTGPPDPESAKHMTSEGYQWHEDTRRWRHQETHDSAVRANGTQNGTFISGTHAPKGKYGYMATASVGSDGNVTATADSSNYAITHNGTHKVESNLGGNPPTQPHGIQSHQLGTALAGAGVDHGGTSTTFPLGNLNNTGMKDSTHYNPPGGGALGGPALRGAATMARGMAGALAHDSGLADSKIGTTVTRAAKIGGGLINQALGKEYENMTAIELLQLHVALQKMEKQKIAV